MRVAFAFGTRQRLNAAFDHEKGRSVSVEKTAFVENRVRLETEIDRWPVQTVLSLVEPGPETDRKPERYGRARADADRPDGHKRRVPRTGRQPRHTAGPAKRWPGPVPKLRYVHMAPKLYPRDLHTSPRHRPR